MSKIFFGTPIGVRVGQCFNSRMELIEADLHRFTVHGIDGNGDEGASAIVLSDGYEDDEDFGDYIIYTGHGGNDSKTKKQIEHQSWESPGNKGLVVSQQRKLPVRVIRGFKPPLPRESFRVVLQATASELNKKAQMVRGIFCCFKKKRN